MKKAIFAMVAVALLCAGPLYAYCYNFQNGDGYKVCVKGDSFDARKKAQEICKNVKGSDCGNIQGSSSSCNGNKCVDQDGKKQNSLSGY